LQVLTRNGPAFVADAMNGDYAPPFGKKPKHTRIQLSDVPKLEQAFAQGLREWFPVILAISQFRKSGEHSGEIVWICLFEIIEESLNRYLTGNARIKLYSKIHICSTSILMY